MQGLRKCSSLDVVEYMGDPVLQPIRSFENATLVRVLHHLSCGLNDRVYIVPYTTKFSPKAHTLYWDNNFDKFNFTNRASYLSGSCGWSS